MLSCDWLINLRLALLVRATLRINLVNTLDERYIWKNQRFRRKIFQDVRYLKGSGLLLMYKLTITYILYLTKAPVQENEVFSFV